MLEGGGECHSAASPVVLVARVVGRASSHRHRRRAALLPLAGQYAGTQTTSDSTATSGLGTSRDCRTFATRVDCRKDKEFLALAKNHVEQHITDPQYNVEGLASDLCMSRSNLLRRIQSLTGLSPVEFIRDIRLKHAAKMISEHPKLAMSEVAQRVGFATPSYFAKCFKKRFGILPTQYANRRNTEDNARNAEF